MAATRVQGYITSRTTRSKRAIKGCTLSRNHTDQMAKPTSPRATPDSFTHSFIHSKTQQKGLKSPPYINNPFGSSANFSQRKHHHIQGWGIICEPTGFAAITRLPSGGWPWKRVAAKPRLSERQPSLGNVHGLLEALDEDPQV